MGKRSNFARIARDAYDTPREAVLPLLPHLKPGTRFCEPCAGRGELVSHLSEAGHVCVAAYDIEPRGPDIQRLDALDGFTPEFEADAYITNPPWDRKILHPLIVRLSALAPTWLLFDADWMHTKQAAPYLPLLRRVVSIGRVKWIPGSKMTGKDNCCWYLFDAMPASSVEFIGRIAA